MKQIVDEKLAGLKLSEMVATATAAAAPAPAPQVDTASFRGEISTELFQRIDSATQPIRHQVDALDTRVQDIGNRIDSIDVQKPVDALSGRFSEELAASESRLDVRIKELQRRVDAQQTSVEAAAPAHNEVTADDVREIAEQQQRALRGELSTHADAVATQLAQAQETLRKYALE